MGACSFSRQERQLIPAYVMAQNEEMLNCEVNGSDTALNVVAGQLGMSNRELEEFKKKMAFTDFDDSQYTLDISSAKSPEYFQELYNG